MGVVCFPLLNLTTISTFSEVGLRMILHLTDVYDNSFRDYLSFKSIESWIETNTTEVFNLDTLEIKEGVELPISDYAFTACSL